ncbi:MAG: CPBP family intramembrane metalloprotease [Lachnospiraceae bacterium]|nr:CPBP family intramembrane metalloprotease [Lachnospiraceae bacterium]
MECIWVILYGVIYLISEIVSDYIGLKHIITIISLGMLFGSFCLFAYKRKCNADYGLQGIKEIEKKQGKCLLAYVPLLSMPLLNIILGKANGVDALLISEGILVLWGALFEELFFRGFLMHIFHKRLQWKTWISVVISAIIFGLFHLNNLYVENGLYVGVQAASALAMGICFGIAFLRTRSLIPGMLIHAGMNVTAVFMPIENETLLWVYLLIAILHIPYAIWLYQGIEKKREDKEYKESER